MKMTMCFWLTKKNICMWCKVCLMCPSSVSSEMWSDLLAWYQNTTRTLFLCVYAHLDEYTHILMLKRTDMKNPHFQASTCLLYRGIPQSILVSTYDKMCHCFKRISLHCTLSSHPTLMEWGEASKWNLYAEIRTV